jgi:hypothetical protein
VDFDNDGDAEKAKKELIGKDLKGLKINIGKFPISKFFFKNGARRTTVTTRRTQRGLLPSVARSVNVMM